MERRMLLLFRCVKTSSQGPDAQGSPIKPVDQEESDGSTLQMAVPPPLTRPHDLHPLAAKTFYQNLSNRMTDADFRCRVSLALCKLPIYVHRPPIPPARVREMDPSISARSTMVGPRTTPASAENRLYCGMQVGATQHELARAKDESFPAFGLRLHHSPICLGSRILGRRFSNIIQTTGAYFWFETPQENVLVARQRIPCTGQLLDKPLSASSAIPGR